MSKKLIIIMAVAGLLSFAGTFAFAWLTKKTPQAAQEAPAHRQADLRLTLPQMPSAGSDVTVDGKMKKAMTEKQLKSLIYEIREQIQEYNRKLENLDVREQRLQIAQETLKRDIDQLDNLRVELASTVARLKNEQDKLLRGRVEIAQIEKNNLMGIALTYDKMDAVSASKILTNMNQAENAAAEDAVKILHYMTERTKAKVLASIAETEPETSAYFCQKLKQISEKE